MQRVLQKYIEGSRLDVQRAALAACLGLNQPVKRDVMREDEVFFDVPDAKAAFQTRCTRGALA